MKKPTSMFPPRRGTEQGGGGSYLLLWLIGVPFPILAIIFLLKGCS